MRPLAAIILLLTFAGAARAPTSQPSWPSAAEGGIIRRTSTATSQPSSAKAVDDSIGTFRVLLSLAAVLGLIVLMYWASRRMLPRGAFGGGGTAAIRVLGRASISAKHRVVLLQVGRRVLVVAEGAGAQPLNTLCEITDPDEAAALIGQIRSEQSAGGKSFGSLLNSATERFRAATADESRTNAMTSEQDPLAATQQQLDDLTRRVRGLARHFERA
jgi:flagellar biogenesis protein FliO